MAPYVLHYVRQSSLNINFGGGCLFLREMILPTLSTRMTGLVLTVAIYLS